MGDEQHLPGVEPVTGQVLRLAENPLDAFNIVFYIIVSQFYKYNNDKLDKVLATTVTTILYINTIA